MDITASHSVLLISANDLLWTGVHVAMQSVSDVVVVDDVTDIGRAADRARELQPAVIVTGIRIGGTPMLPILEQVHECCPETRMIVLGESFQPTELLALASMNVVACLLWQHLDFTALQRCIGAVLSGDFVIMSRPAATQLLELRDVQRSADGESITLTERERVVLQGLAEGLTQEQIARAASLGLRTVKRTTATLSAKLRAPSPFVLGARARDLGLVPTVA